MKGDFTRFTHDPAKRYTRVLKQQGRVDLDADWNEAVEILTHRDRTEATDVIGRCGAPIDGGGFRIEASPDGSDLEISSGRLYVDGILCEIHGEDPVSITNQEDLPGLELPDDDGIYLAYVDVWDRHITYLEDPDIREVALGGPDTTTRTKTICQVKLHRLAENGSLEDHECQPFPATPSTGRMAAGAASAGAPTSPCAVPEGAGYTGLENRLYRVEIHDDGRDEEGNPGARPVTFKWSRDNGSVVLPLVDENGISGNTVTLRRLGHDEVLTIRNGDIVEVSGETTELHGRPGTLAQIVPDGINRNLLRVELDRSAADHDQEAYLKLRRWDHHETDDVPLIDGALELPAGPFELEDGVIIEFEAGGTFHTGDYWVIPARTREGSVLWPQEGTPPAGVLLEPFGIHHHYCTLALIRRSAGVWEEVHDCRPLFPPLTEVDGGCCCRSVDPGEDIQQAIDAVVAAGGGCISLCAGEHVVRGTLRISSASDVVLHGTGSATMIRFVADDAASAGLVIQNTRRIEIRDLLLLSHSTPALISIRHDLDLALNRQIAFRRLTLLNYFTSESASGIGCGIRAGHTDGITIDECRIASEAGVVALWGNALPDLAAVPQSPGSSPPILTADFDDVTLGRQFQVGEEFSSGGVDIRCERFQWSNGEFDENGVAAVEDGGQAGGTGHELQVSNILLSFTLPATYSTARVRFGDFGGNANLRVNGDFRNVERLVALDGEVVGGVRVRVSMDADGSQRGLLSVDADAQDIADFALGGQELWIDAAVFRGPGEAVPSEPVLDYGSGVHDLRMRDTVIRFRDVGILAAHADEWKIDRCDIQPVGEEEWSIGRERSFGDISDLLAVRAPGERRRVVDDRIWNAGEARSGAALLAFRWHACAIRGSVFSGSLGAIATWWTGGAAVGNEFRTDEAGMRAMWTYESDWSHNYVRTDSGIAVAFSGCCRLRLDHKRLRGPIGVANQSLEGAMSDLQLIANVILRAYGDASELSAAVLDGVFVDESLELMGFRNLLDALQPMIDQDGAGRGIPTAYYVAAPLLSMLRRGGLSGVIPLIDLELTHSDIVCAQQGILLEGILPLGSLRVADNHIHTTSGQALKVEANRFAANVHLLVYFLRALLVLIERRIDEARDQGDDGESDAVLGALHELVLRWQQGSEQFFDLDFRIEGNTIRSLRTAIESNLFELAILTNHITMQERPLLRTPENTAAIFGRVMMEDGTPLAGVAIRVVDSNRGVVTNADGAYRMAGLPAGTYVLRATAPGVTAQAESIRLRASEQVEVNLTARQQGRMTRLRESHGSSDTVMARLGAQVSSSNAEIEDVMSSLERSSALEPLSVSLREGARVMPEAYASHLAADEGPFATAAERRTAAESVSAIRGHANDVEMQQVAEELSTALRANDRTALAPLLARFIQNLQRYIDSQGILVKGVGGRIIGNQILVPVDAHPETEALGGIQVSVNLSDLAILLALSRVLVAYLGGTRRSQLDIVNDPLHGITETLIATNEVIGGAGHGVSVQGVAGQPDFVSDLRIRGNQIRGMAGTGIFINEHALVVGLDVSGNHVSECGRNAGFALHKGGITVDTAAVCRLNDNHIVRCGSSLAGRNAYGVSFDGIYGLRFSGNEVQANGSSSGSSDDGGLRLVEVYGGGLIQNNVLSFNRGLGLSWVNSAREGESALLPPFLMQAVNQYLRSARRVDDLVAEEHASVQGNAFTGVAESDLPLFQLLNLRRVLFNDNTCYAETTGAPLGEIQQTTRGIVNNNQTQTSGDIAIAIKKMADGVVMGNVGNRPVQLQTSANVERGFNVPAAI